MPALPCVFVSHGGGPWPWMQGPMREAHRSLERALRVLPEEIAARPTAILAVSAHWEASAFTVGTAQRHALLYDYHGFPPETYALSYAPQGAAALAEGVSDRLAAAGLPVAKDSTRGLDHGVFVPIAVSWPGADIPVVPLSLLAGLDPERHLHAGEALKPLREEGVLVLASGSSYHNLRDRGREGPAPSAAFDAWLQQVLVAVDPAGRRAALIEWERAPAARIAHPREEHLLPLMVAVGAAGRDVGRCVFREPQSFGYATVSNFLFGG